MSKYIALIIDTLNHDGSISSILSPDERIQHVLQKYKNGEQGAKRNAVLLNAGAGLYIGGKADTFREGVELAASLIDGGQVKQKLEDFIKESNK